MGCAASALLVPAAHAQDGAAAGEEAAQAPSSEAAPQPRFVPPAPRPTGPVPPVDPRTPIITDEEFDKAIPSLDDAPLESIEEWQRTQDAQNESVSTDASREQVEQAAAERANPALRDGDAVELLPDPPVVDPLLDEPLPSIDSFDAEPPPEPTEAAEAAPRAVRYVLRLEGLDPAESPEVASDPDGDIYRRARNRFYELSALDDGDGRADSRAEVSQRARADRQLLLDILTSEGFFDATVRQQLQRGDGAGGGNNGRGNGNGNGAGDADAPLSVVLVVVPGRRYYLGQIAFDAPVVTPPDLITRNFVPKSGDPIVADTILAAEANIAVKLPENGYPFAKVGQRDILLDGDTGLGDYTLPVEPGARSVFGQIRSEGNEAFDAAHVAKLRRFCDRRSL
jgi:translocation and assembly module TamA